MITVFSIPKRFDGVVGVNQRNAIRSWAALGDDVQVILLGDDEGTAEAARECGVMHIPDIARNRFGTPRLDDAFAKVEREARTPLRCFLNADIILLDDFLPAVQRTSEVAGQAFLMIGRTTNLKTDVDLDFRDAAVREELRRRAELEGTSRGATAIDYFAFSVGLFDPLPPFAVGRARFDNWFVWQGRQRGMVVDASEAVLAIHQSHDYGHVEGGADYAHAGEEAQENQRLGGGKRHMYTIHDASHLLGADRRIRRNAGAVLRLRENMRKAAWKLAHR